MQSSFDVLELAHVLQMVAGFTHTSQAKSALLSLRPLEDAVRKKELASLEEASKMIELGGALPLGESIDLSERIDLARKGGNLNEDDFSRILGDLQTLREIKRHMTRLEMRNALIEKTLALSDLEPLRQGILRVLNPDLTIKDTASVELKRIRGTLERKKRELTSRLGQILDAHKAYLSGNSWTMRNGHYVLPIANSYKHQVKGLVQDVSSSGGTTFIEPEALVRIHNDIALLEADEREEIRRILASLSRIVGVNAREVVEVNETLGYLDFLQAKVLYAISIDGHLAKDSPDGSLFIAKARHPLIDPKKVVPNDFSLSAKRRILVLSGPNAGGKTVALKTLGVLCMMFSMALPLPCAQGAEIPSFGNVFLDIGDSQSIFDNLSTFSGHIKNIEDILNVAQKGDLILLDEVGTGTSPKEGEALALAILDELRELGCYALISSHFEALKAKALSSEDVENASLLFDEQTLTPTYLLRVGLPGESYGLEVARRLGLNDRVLSRAKTYLKEEEDLSVNQSLRHLGELTRQAEEKEAESEQLRASLRQKEAEIAKLQRDLERKSAAFDEEMKKAKKEILENAQEQVNEAIAALRNPGVKLHEAIAAKHALDKLEEETVEEHFDEEIHVGDYVEIPSYGIEGRVDKLSGDKLTLVGRDGKPIKTTRDMVHKIAAPKEEKKRREAPTHIDALPSKGLSLELNIIGLRVDEAMTEVDHYLDSCRLKGFKRVRIIHGLGSGALRRAVAEYCSSHKKFIEKFELGGEFEGGGGATVVYLK
ncbi:MAG: endonuclease MutS2 [Bacilli bacterium]|nr:endonuclease MutS2 [Bacilli bacterium]